MPLPLLKPSGTSTTEFVDHPKGEPLVQQPPHPGQCWALIKKRDMNRPYRCTRYRRGVYLGLDLCTCPVHHLLEKTAQALKAKLAENSSSPGQAVDH